MTDKLIYELSFSDYQATGELFANALRDADFLVCERCGGKLTIRSVEYSPRHGGFDVVASCSVCSFANISIDIKVSE